MADEMRRRHAAAGQAFREARLALGLTQEQAAQESGIVTKSVYNFENGTYPSARARAALERVVGWPAGEIERRAGRRHPEVDPRLVERLSQLTPAEREWLIRWLRKSLSRRDAGPPHAGEGQPAMRRADR